MPVVEAVTKMVSRSGLAGSGWPTGAAALAHHSVVAQVARGRAVDMGVGLAVVEDAEANAGDDEVSGTVGKRGGVSVWARSVYIGALPKSKPANVMKNEVVSAVSPVCAGRFVWIASPAMSLMFWLNTIRYVLPGAQPAIEISVI